MNDFLLQFITFRFILGFGGLPPSGSDIRKDRPIFSKVGFWVSKWCFGGVLGWKMVDFMLQSMM